ncbi:MAG: hypothetical protein JSW50_12925 [Candidatus Latescibacterota bacterium]|nr:MAG: hypothetical protein JSW50_12925 [Candidatus Latescibacterota bacterium]
MRFRKENNILPRERQHLQVAPLVPIRLGRLLGAGILVLALLTTPSSVYPQGKPKVLYQSVGLSPGVRYSRPLGIFYDKNRRECYVADTGNHQVVVCDDNGTAFYRFLHRITDGDKPTLGEPTGLVVDRSGRIFLLDGAVEFIDVLDHRGRRIQKVFPPVYDGEDPLRFKALALGPDEEVYAALSSSIHTVVVIDSALNIRREIVLDAPGSQDACISAIAVDDSSNIYITDPCATETMVQIYDANGKFLSGFGEHSAGLENFSFPAGIVVLANGNMWVLDTIRQIASCFSSDGEFITYIGGRGNQPGAFDFPSALTTDGFGLLFVLERAGCRYQCFRLPENE